MHVVTVNDYLAKRDSEWMGPVFRFLGLTVGVVQHDVSNVERQAGYLCDITYVTNNEIGFDYLRDNMVVRKEDRVLRPLYYAIIDEVDSILVDEARTPLIISGAAEKSTERYAIVNKLIPHIKTRLITEEEEIQAKYTETDLQKGWDAIVDEKNHTAILTEEGIQKCEALLGLKNLYDDLEGEWVHHITQALRAHFLYKRDVEYVVKDGECIIVDEFTGRLMPGRRWSDGLHQAVEAKENLPPKEENQTLATITFQNFFKIYRKRSGMTGTAMTEEDEFLEIYNMEVREIPTNRIIARKDLPDQVYKSEREKFNAIVEQIKVLWKEGRPVLVGTRSIEKSEKIAAMLRGVGIPHRVLNAKYHEMEASIIAQAGGKASVTIATNMAGRGTDILLGGNPQDLASYEEIKKLGGLHVLGTERHESRRIDNQLRGRCARQGDPGSTQFFLALDDELMRLFGSDRIAPFMEKLGMQEGEVIESGLVSYQIENAQRRVETHNFDIRKQLLDYDNVMNKQREVIYSPARLRAVRRVGQPSDPRDDRRGHRGRGGRGRGQEAGFHRVGRRDFGGVPGPHVRPRVGAVAGRLARAHVRVPQEGADEGRARDLRAPPRGVLGLRLQGSREDDPAPDDRQGVEGPSVRSRSSQEGDLPALVRPEGPEARVPEGIRGDARRHDRAHPRVDGRVRVQGRGAQGAAAAVDPRDAARRGASARRDGGRSEHGPSRAASAAEERGRPRRGVLSGAGGNGLPDIQKIGRNDPCFCGSGKKFKKCHGAGPV